MPRCLEELLHPDETAQLSIQGDPVPGHRNWPYMRPEEKRALDPHLRTGNILAQP